MCINYILYIFKTCIYWESVYLYKIFILNIYVFTHGQLKQLRVHLKKNTFNFFFKFLLFQQMDKH